MLDLQPRVHLQKVVVAVAVEHELAGSGVDVADRLRRADRSRSHGVAQFGRQRDRRRFFDDLLMAPLNRTLAFAEMNRRAVRVGKNLKLDVARIAQIAFEQHRVVAERGQRLTLGGVERFFERGGRCDDAHAAAAAARARLDQQRKADAFCLRAQRLEALIVAVVSRDGRHVELAHAALGFDLAAHRGHRIRRRTDERHSRRGNGPRERRALRKKAVTGMHRIGAHRHAGGDDRVDVEIRVRRGRRPDAAGVVDEPQMIRVGVGLGVDAERYGTGLARTARHAYRDFSAIRDEQPADHAWKLALRRSRNARRPS